MGKEAVKQPEQSDTAASVLLATLRKMTKDPKFKDHFGETYYDLSAHIMDIAKRARKFSPYKLNDYVFKFLERLPDAWKSAFFNLMVCPEYDSVITARKVMLSNLLDYHIKYLGVKQVVILGGGYDPRAADFARLNRKIKFFEADMKGPTRTQKLEGLRTFKDKDGKLLFTQELLSTGASRFNGNLTLIPCDFEKEDLEKALTDNGYDPKLKTVVFGEGLTVYLSEKTVDKLLADAEKLISPESAMVIGFMPPIPITGPLKWFLRSSNENCRLFLAKEDIPDFFQKRGLKVETVSTIKTTMKITGDGSLEKRFATKKKAVETYCVLKKASPQSENHKDFKDIPELSEEFSKLANQKPTIESKKEEKATSTVQDDALQSTQQLTSRYDDVKSKKPSFMDPPTLGQVLVKVRKRCCAIQ